MASVHTNTYGGRTITLEVVEESWSIETNTSVVRWTLRSGTSSTYHSVYQITAWVGGTDDAHKVYGPKTADWSSRAFPCKDGSTTGTVTVQHNADGTASPLTFRLRGSVYNNNPQNYDGSIDLTTIPRATTDWSISGNTIGSNVTVTLRPNSSSFTHRVICYFGNDSQELSVASNQQSASATIKMAFCNQVPNATSGSGTMVVETYNAGQLIGSNSKPITLNVPNDVVPSISSVTKSDTANLVGTYGAYVQGKSNLRVVTSSSGSYSSSISNVTVNIKDSNDNILRQLTGSDVTLSSISYVGNLTIQVVVTDTRGRQASDTNPISVVEYFNPRINSFNAERRNNDNTVTITFSADICNINNNNVNSKEFRLYKRQKGTSSWGTAILTYNSAYSYSRNDFTTTCDENYGWEFLLQAQDSFTTTGNDNPEVGTAFELINWGADGTSMAVGKVSEKSNTLEVALKTELVDTDIDGTLNVNGNEKFVPLYTQSLNLNDIGVSDAYSQEIAIHNTRNGNIINAPYDDEVAILKTYSWGANPDWVIQEWYGLISRRKYIREKSPQGWLNWERIYKATIIWEGETNNTISNLPYYLTDFDFIEIVYTDEVGRIGGSLKFKPVDGNAICLTLTETENGFIVIKSGHWHSNGNSLVRDSSSFTQISHSNSTGGNNNPDWIHIWKIIGWK